MSVAFTRWPDDLAARYRAAGYWNDQPMTEMLARQCRERPDAPAVLCGEREISYAVLDRRSDNLAAWLLARGVARHDTALVQLPNVAEFYIALFALFKIGAAPVNALFSHQKLELSAYARQIQPKLLIADRRHPLFGNDAMADELAAISPALSVRLFAHDELEAVLERDCGGLPDQAGPSAADEVAFFQLSGGSTGTPKLIPRTHNDYFYSVRRSAEICELGPHTRFLCALPAPHNFPLSSPGALGVFHAGGAVVLAPNPEALACFALVERHQVDIAALVPPAVALWLQAAPGREAQLKSLKLLQVGGASFAEATARQVPEVLGCKLQQVFGMAEGLVNYTRLDDGDDIVYGCQGRPMSDADEVKVVDEAGHPVPLGAPGMLATRGPYTFRGYYLAPEHNARVFDNEGFYYSGDVVVADERGYLRVVGRVKDQINRGGEKIAAEEIEHLLLQHPQVAQAALVAMPDAMLGEKSCAYVVAHEDGLKSVALRRFLREQGVADYKLPDRFELVDTLPLTHVGKIDKQALRGMLAAAAGA
ncbi:(2,3-dihydroxybenzoyl)adenylate synthase [Pseudogulbenkiania ferrooxidans]|uniref:Enterobactin synthase subunit E n=1 Tax=Pseudogulbenkiania ferrooxidans EGD-HP2 TaxID=1388764 RepID=A0ABP2XPR7_9NEIS|nr:(2,3-dihydroxybenzoyl)adenylate synthase [Pseudogulbenkiania ferrooxidans]ERE16699.1 enterobactin synthase subunit E [Pseudogulbenkiania ferrooxidans EGD-HP2]